MVIGVVGCKVGMICIFMEDGQVLFVMVIEVEFNCII